MANLVATQRKLKDALSREEQVTKDLYDARGVIGEIKEIIGVQTIPDNDLPSEIQRLRSKLTKAESKGSTLEKEHDNQPSLRNSPDLSEEEVKAMSQAIKQLEKDKKELQKQLLNEVNFNKQLQIKSKATSEIQNEGKNQIEALRNELARLASELETTRARLASALSSLDISERKLRESENTIRGVVEDSNVDQLIREELRDENLTDPHLKLSILPNSIAKFIRQHKNMASDLANKSALESNRVKNEGSYRERLKDSETHYALLLNDVKGLKMEHQSEIEQLKNRMEQMAVEIAELNHKLADAMATVDALRDANAILEDARNDDVSKSRDLRRREEQLKEAENRLFKLRDKLQEKDKALKEREEQLSSRQPQRKPEVTPPKEEKSTFVRGEGVMYGHFLEKINNRDLIEELINTLPRDSQLALYLQNRESDPREPKAVCDELR